MGNQPSRDEQLVLIMWKTFITPMGIAVSDEALCDLMGWTRDHGYPVELSAALSLRTWEELDDCLLEEVCRGDALAAALVTTWRRVSQALLGKTPRGINSERGISGSEDVSVLSDILGIREE